LLLLVPNVLMIGGNLVTPSLANRVRPAYLIAGGLLVAGVGYVMFTLAGSTSGPTAMFVAMCVVMLGTAPLAALCNHLAMGAVPPERAGSGAAVVQTTTELGLGLGIATLATLATSVYQSNVEGALLGLPTAVADAARETIDRAIAAAGQLPAEQGGDLVAAARDAFTSGVHVVGIVSAIAYAGLAILAVRTFKSVRNADGDEKPIERQPETASTTDA
jgi:DHA2 family multidrug resistance protein-like MFS transporter